MAVQDGQDRSVPSAHLAIRCDFADQAHDPLIPRPSWRITDRLEKSIRRADLFKRASNVGLLICPLGIERRRYYSEVAMRIVSTLGTLILMSFAVPAAVEAGRTAPYFAFHNSFWMNLHQTLFHEANLRKLPPEKHARFDPSSLPDAPLSSGEHEAWDTAVTYYAEKFAGRLQVFDDELIGSEAASPLRIDVTFWVDVIGHAYTTDHTTISSGTDSLEGMDAVETVFHEGAHTIVYELQKALSKVCEQQKKDGRDLWHAVQFYTVGEVIKDELRKQNIDYTPYALKYGVFRRGPWPKYLIAIEKDWKPYLDGEQSFDQAVKSLVRDI